MDSLELLQILDVIRNEKLYNERLDVLRKAEEAFKEQKLIAETLKMAQKRLEEAKDIVAKANKKYDDIVAQAEVEATKRLAEASEKEASLARKEEEFHKRRMEIEEKFKEARAMRNESVMHKEAIASGYRKLAEDQVALNRVRDEYYEKVNALRTVMGV